MSEMHTDSTSPEQTSPVAIRMRRSRARRQRGEMIVTLEVGPSLIPDLIAKGWLAEADKADKGAIARALIQIAERGLGVNVTPSAGLQGYMSFICDLKATTVDTLISLQWLPIEHASDINTIATAFRRFAGRALDLARRGKLDLWNFRPR